jgi:hypothetical protein
MNWRWIDYEGKEHDFGVMQQWPYDEILAEAVHSAVTELIHAVYSTGHLNLEVN